MQVLNLLLSPVDRTHMKVITHSYGSLDVVLPYDGLDTRRATILKALNLTSFDPKAFTGKDEQEWMVEAGLLDVKRRAFHPNMRANIGKALYQTLFPPDSKTRDLLHSMIFVSKSKSSPEQILIQLEIDADVGRHSRLFDYPWELLHDERDFLAASGIAISRYIAYEDPPPNLLSVDRINVLLVSSTACDPTHHLTQLGKKEHQAILDSLRGAEEKGRINLHELTPATFGNLRHYVLAHTGEDTPYVIHFDGHGHFGRLCNNTVDDKECKTFHPGTLTEECQRCGASLPEPEGYLLFEDNSGGTDYISAKEIGSMLGLANGNNGAGRGIALVVLSACKSSLALMEESVFNGVAQNLIAHQIPAVVGMAFSVSVEGAKAFADVLYFALSQKKSLAQAMNWGRNAMGFKGNQWYRPSLYIRWRDNEGGQIFTPNSKRNQFSQEEDQNSADTSPKALDPLRLETGTVQKSTKSRASDPIQPLPQPPDTSDFIAQAVEFYRDIEANRNLLTEVSELFREEDIWPDQCRSANNSLQKVSDNIQHLYDLLDSNADLTEIDVNLHSSLVIPLNLSRDLLRELITLISAFSTVCRTSSREVTIRLQEIRSKLRDLEGSLDEIRSRMAPFDRSANFRSIAAAKPKSVPANSNKRTQSTKKPSTASNDSGKLYEIMLKAYSLPDTRTLCGKLGIDPDDLPGSTREDKIRELIRYCGYRNMYVELIGKVKDERPHLREELDKLKLK